MDATPPNRHKRRLGLLARGASMGLLAVSLGFAAQDLADRFSGASDPPLRARLRRVVVSSPAYASALEVADSEAVRAAIGGAPRVTLTELAVEDDAGATRLRFTLRLEAAVVADLQVDARWARGDDAVVRAVLARPGRGAGGRSVSSPGLTEHSWS